MAILVFCIAIFYSAIDAPAAILTVGPSGDFTTVQGAIDYAVGLGGDNEIRVETGSYIENLVIPSSMTSGFLSLLGGWDGLFLSRTTDPSATVIDSDLAGRPLRVENGGGEVVADGFTLTGGYSDSFALGGGVYVYPTSNGVVRITHCDVVNNSVVQSGASGGGVWATVYGQSEFYLTNCRISGNLASGGMGPALAGGLYVTAHDSSTVLLSDLVVEDNVVSGSHPDRNLQYGGVLLIIDDDANGRLLDSVIAWNRIEGAGHSWAGGGSLSGMGLTVRRCLWLDNESNTGNADFQLILGTVTMTDSVVAGGNTNSVLAGGHSVTIQNTNLTIVDSPGAGFTVAVYDDSQTSLFNTILSRNASDVEILAGSLNSGNNLIGQDPFFVNPEERDYRLRIGSPAENQGTNSPQGGLGPADCDGGPRIVDGVVDIGAYEGISEVFVDSFESGNTSAWTTTFP
ncbi:MAG: hypothetical protein K8R59_11310 [Thermoanaerobaculales bacterium]|nr:hypothetical protein [Thermoanaerobaculales bacterium]